MQLSQSQFKKTRNVGQIHGMLNQGRSFATRQCIHAFLFGNFLKVEILQISFSNKLEKINRKMLQKKLFWLSWSIKDLWGTKVMHCYVLNLFIYFTGSVYESTMRYNVCNVKRLLKEMYFKKSDTVDCGKCRWKTITNNHTLEITYDFNIEMRTRQL